MWKRSVILLALAACGSSTAPGSAGVYDLTSLRSASEPASCGRTLQSALTSSTLTIGADGTASFEIHGWYDYYPTSLGTCPAISRSNTSTTKSGTATVSGDAISIALHLPANSSTFYATGHVSGRDLTLTTVNTSVFGSIGPYSLLQPSTWHRR